MAAVGGSDFFDAQAKQWLRFWWFGTVQKVHIQTLLALDGANFEVLSTCLELDIEVAVSPGLAEEVPGTEIKMTTLV